MAHYEQLKFVELTAAHLADRWDGVRVLEIGAQDVNGSVKSFFAGSAYLGVDLAEGRNVDLVASGHELAFEDGAFDLTLSCECFEHNPHWAETFANMWRMTRPGGVVLISSASKGRYEHGTTRTLPEASPGSQAIGWDYYRNLREADFRRAFDLDAWFQSYFFVYNAVSKDLYFVGRKPGADGAFRFDREKLAAEIRAIRDPQRSAPPNTVVARTRRLIVGAAENLPDRAFQEFIIQWSRATGLIKRLRPGSRIA